MLTECTKVEIYSGVIKAIEDLLSQPRYPAEGAIIVTDTSQLTYTSWRTSIKDCVQAIIEPHELNWTVENDSFPDGEFISQALRTVKERFEHPLYNRAASARISLAQTLGKLPCMVVHASRSDCSSASKPDVDFLSPFVPVVDRLCNGPANEVTAGVRKAVFQCLSHALRHHTSGYEDRKFDRLTNSISQSLQDDDRSVRLSAGSALTELIRLYLATGRSAWEQTEGVYVMMHRLFETAEDCVKETALITLGRIGRIATADALGQTLCCLIAQLGQRSTILRGTARIQLTALAKYHRKTPWLLFSPYMDDVAPYLVSRLQSQPNLLREACGFFSKEPYDFVSINLHCILPKLFITCDAAALHAVADILDRTASHLFIEYAHNVLALTFRLREPGQTDKTIRFIQELLEQTAGCRVETSRFVGGYIVPLLAELVMFLGHEDPDEAASAREALKKVERTMSPSSTPALTRSRSSISQNTSQTTSNFLKPYMLGIITHLNDLLCDVMGKLPVASKKMIIRCLGSFAEEVGPTVINVAPQVMATLQSMIAIPEFADATLQSWYAFLTTLDEHDLGPYVGSTSASLLTFWPTFSQHGQRMAKQCLDFIVRDRGGALGAYLDEVADLEAIPELSTTHQALRAMRETWEPRDKLRKILDRLNSESTTVSVQSLKELRSFMLFKEEEDIRSLTSGDMFDPLIGRMIMSLFSAASRDGEGTETLRMLALDCIGILGAVDPDRLEIGTAASRMVVSSNFQDEDESVLFALHLIKDVLVDAYRSTSDTQYQILLAYAIQELLRFCKFSSALIASRPSGSVGIKVRNRWNSLPKHVLETVSPLLDFKLTMEPRAPTAVEHPIYPSRATYREWIQAWTGHLITKVSGEHAKAIFQLFSAPVRNKDVGVAHHILPHLVLNVLLSGSEEEVHNIRQELLAVLDDRPTSESQIVSDKKLLSSQTVFMLLDHLNQWVRIVGRDIRNKKAEKKPRRTKSQEEEQLLRIDSVLSSIDVGLMAKAALQCKAYARSLMNFERQILVLQSRGTPAHDLHEYHERLHEIYAHLEEPDGMEGVSTLLLSPSLEVQIRQHESTGRWTSAQSCWEVRLQQSPDNLDFHLGLLRCLRNLGHHDTLRTHVKGVLTRNPGWQTHLVGYQVESEWMIGNWVEVRNLIEDTTSKSAPVLLARVLLACRTGDDSLISDALAVARRSLGAPITATDIRGYRRSYDTVLNLHLIHELEVIHNAIGAHSTGDRPNLQATIERLTRRLSTRLDSTLPNFRIREPILSMRRTAFGLRPIDDENARENIAQCWLTSAKTARKAGHWQTAHSAILQAQQCNATFYSSIESAKLKKASGDAVRALQELESSMRLSGLLSSGGDELVGSTGSNQKVEAKAHTLRARWMAESDRFDSNQNMMAFRQGIKLSPKWESGYFHLGRWYDEYCKGLPPREKHERGLLMNFQTVLHYAKAMRFGSKYIYQTIPRLLTIWLDMGEDETLAKHEIFEKINLVVSNTIKSAPVYKWYTAFPQIVSRVGHTNKEVYVVLSQLISMVIREYPKQALWLFTSVVESTKEQRRRWGKTILDKLRVKDLGELAELINESLKMTAELLALCDRRVKDDKKMLSMVKDVPGLWNMVPSRLIIPLQESLVASLPPNSSSDSGHQPFPVDVPTFHKFLDEVEIMRTMAKPRKISIEGSNGQTYMFLGKPKDDLRKDARLMDFNAIINKLLKSSSESRRRQLRIRTYGVVTLNEECGFIQWVPNTVPLRPILLHLYERRGLRHYTPEMASVFALIKTTNHNRDAAKLFRDKILKLYPPVFHEWLLETFPEPNAWLAARLTYSRTTAVMSMVGFILGLGDRHCENILLDTCNGDMVHVDFNCLFDKASRARLGKALEVPELVPFRLTQNIVDGFGVTGVEGPYRLACEVTMQLLRDNRDTLMSVLDAFVHDPLVEWEDEKRKKVRRMPRANSAPMDARELAKNALKPIELKLNGIYTTSRDKPAKELVTSSLVELLIQEASSDNNLARMYAGWAPWQ
ncbi:hypothetical protein WOLCODRAFT_69995 [Wolfiporia cocos MD-104 SS10]|uniref:non-specific serine/threonine protein kinase n=1 Tax=Wolfiporia cocos (strain MD-104) TaxID=742152 RepID=A0A2H3JT05_WOLCO|nr:hypothetical protein WOLCODRAFT_69995 [Wolfiporia cocos MD-104 SS10]